MRIHLALHIHSDFSADSNITLNDIISQCKQSKINCIGLTDHNTALGALTYQKKLEENEIQLIVGEEIKTDAGEIIGLFLKRNIIHKKNGKVITLNEAVREIKNQNGLVFAPHPFDKFRLGIGKNNCKEYQDQIDAYEIFNSRTKISYFNKQAEKYVLEHNLTPFIGSDAHIAREIPHAIIEMEEFKTKEEFLRNLKRSDTVFYKQRLRLIDIVRPTINNIKKKIFYKKLITNS